MRRGRLRKRPRLELLLLALAVIAIGMLASFLVKRPEVMPIAPAPTPEAPVAEEVPPEEAPGIVTCPADYCTDWVKGAGPCPGDILNAYGVNEYIERECYDYPETAGSPEECEGLRSILYEVCVPGCGNGICVDETAQTCPADCT
jgi:hypothetical protein